MARFFISLLLLSATALATQVAPPRPLVGPAPEVHDPAALAAVNFNKDVLPILQKNCQVCHRPGEAAPMSFLSYESTRPWAKAIKQAVVTKKMPPWFAEPGYESYRNDPTLTPHEIAVLSAWVDNGAPEGNAQDKPKAVEWKSGWRIEPDVVISIPAPYKVAARGDGEIKSFLVPTPFTQDTWVSSIEVRPGNPSVVHHVMVQVPEDTPQPSFSWGAAAAPCFAAPALQQDFNESLPIPLPSAPGIQFPGLLNGGTQPNAPRPPRNFALLEAVYAPGTPPMDFSLYNSAKLIKGGGNLRIEVHYTPNGKDTTDQTRVGFKLAKEPPQYRYVTLAPRSLANAQKRIPAGASNWETRGELEFGRDAQVVWLMPHMHLRGKDMAFSLKSPNGSERTILDARFNFNWQLGYEMDQPLRVRKGTRMVVVAHHDNSANNPYNPDASREVGWGDLTTEEMVLPWFGVIVDREADPENILAIRQNGCSAAGRGIFPGLAAPGLPNVPVIQNIPGLPALPVPIPIPLPTIGR